MKPAYSMARRQFGKVPTPIKVVYARMPVAFGMFAGKIGKLDKKLELPQETAFLIREQVAHINICEFCIDIGRSFVIKERMNEAKFDVLQDYRTSPLLAKRSARRWIMSLS
jgi:alkylhydroperoxidase family enzyme